MRFDSYHPFINLLYFIVVFVCVVVFNHPVFVFIAYISIFAYSVKLNGKKQLVFNLKLIPLALLYTVWYSYYNHFGVTNLCSNFTGNSITLESILYGFQVSITVITIVMLLSCMYTIFTTDKVVYLFGKISPKFSLYLAILLRTVPKIKIQVKRINLGQKGIGHGLGQRNLGGRIVDFFRVMSITITWMIEDFKNSVDSMKCRGYSLKGRTAFLIYRFDNRDRTFVVLLFLCSIVMWMGYMLNQTNILFAPEIVINSITPVSILFYIFYALLLLLPMGIQIVGEKKFEHLKKNIHKIIF